MPFYRITKNRRVIVGPARVTRPEEATRINRLVTAWDIQRNARGPGEELRYQRRRYLEARWETLTKIDKDGRETGAILV